MVAIPLMKKLNVLVPHWREHNQEHIAEMQKYLQALQAEGHTELASRCNDTLIQMHQVTEKLAQMEILLTPIKLKA